ncbi:MAG: carboxypeptidase regulatory-like domain-containing protein [Acidobacteriota bacterium]
MKKSLVAVLVVLAGEMLCYSQSRETGAIRGRVVDEQDAAIPGVSVTLTSPSLMGARSTVTDLSGEFRFPALPPGDYKLKAELSDWGTVVQENMRVSTTTTLSVDITMKPAAISEQVTVVAEAPTVDVRSSETASVTLSDEILRNIPNTQFSTDVVNLAPGVTRDVAYGAGDGRGISYQLDGVGVGDPDGGTAWVFVDYNIIEEAKVMGIGLPAEYGNFTGVIFNIVTKSGGNQFSGHFEVDFQGHPERKDLDGTWPAGLWGAENNSAYVEDWPNITSPLESILDANAHLGGPIIQDKLWFFGGTQWYRSKDWVTGFPYPQDYKQPRFYLKLTSQLTPDTNLSGAVEYDDYDGTYRGAEATVMPDATVDQIDPEIVLNGNLTHLLSSKTLIDFKAAYFNGYYNLEPRTGRNVNMHYFINDNPDIPGDQARWTYYNYGAYEEHPRSRVQANASMTHYADEFIKGKHDFKFGVEFEHSRVRNLFSYTGENHWRYYDYWGYGYNGNYSAYQYEGYNARTHITRLETFAQDSWEITNRMNVNVGLRLSQNWGRVAELSGNQYSAFRVAPRLGFTLDLLGDSSTVFKAHYGEFTDGMYSAILDRLSPTFSDWVQYYWDSGGQYWYEDHRVRHGQWVVDEGIEHPFMRQFTAGIEREVLKDASFSVTYINRSYHNFIGPYNSLATYEAVPYYVEELGRWYTLYNLTSGDAAEWHITNLDKIRDLYKNVTGTSTNPYRNYWGIEFLFNKRFSDKWQLIASYVYSQAKGTINNSTYEDIGWGRATYDPNFWVNADGHVTNDPTHMLKLQGTYVLPYNIFFNAYFHAITGNAWAQRYRTGSKDFDQGRITFNTEPAGSHHYPIASALDIRLEKKFALASNYQLGLMLDVFNVFNDDTITSWGTRIGYDWSTDPAYAPSTQGHDLYGLVLPRRVRVGVRLTF